MTRFLEKSFISGTIYRKLQQCMGGGKPSFAYWIANLSAWIVDCIGL